MVSGTEGNNIMSIVDATKMLDEMREYAIRARDGDCARYHERQLRWMFEVLDRQLTDGGPWPDQWRAADADHTITQTETDPPTAS